MVASWSGPVRIANIQFGFECGVGTKCTQMAVNVQAIVEAVTSTEGISAECQ